VLRFKLFDVRSLKSKSLLVHDDLTLYGSEVFVLAETWLTAGDRLGGGVAIIARDSLACSEVTTSHGSSFECEAVRPSDSKLPQINFIHCPPSAHMAQFLRDFSDLLTKRPLFEAGNFGVHVDDVDDPAAMHFLDILTVFGLAEHVATPLI